MGQSERLKILRELAVEQLNSIINSRAAQQIKKLAGEDTKEEGQR